MSMEVQILFIIVVSIVVLLVCTLVYYLIHGVFTLLRPLVGAKGAGLITLSLVALFIFLTYRHDTPKIEKPSAVVTLEYDTRDNTDGLVSLREALDYAQANDKVGKKITFDPSLAGKTISIYDSALEITDSITIDASSIGGAAIEASRGIRVFSVSGGSPERPVELIGLNIMGEKDKGCGGIDNRGVLTIKNSTVSETSAADGSNWNAAIDNFGVLTIADSTVSWNAVDGIDNRGSLTMTGSYVKKNRGKGIVGGSGEATIIDTIISENGGAGIESGARLTLSGSTVSGNGERGIVCGSGETTVIASTVSGNGGGGIKSNGTLKVTDSVISGNSGGDFGGGILNGGTLTVVGSTIAGNSAEINGGIHRETGEVSLRNTILTFNDSSNGLDIGSSMFSGTNNIVGLDPGFAVPPVFESGKLKNVEKLDLSLTPGSIAIDRGANDAVKTETDRAGRPRVFAAWNENPTVDIGAYEYQDRVPRTEPEPHSSVVNTTRDLLDPSDGLISLREALLYAETGQTITFAPFLADQKIVLEDKRLSIDRNLKIDASGIGGITVDGDRKTGVFYIDGTYNETAVELISLTVTGGVAETGGGIYARNVELTLTKSIVTGNTALKNGGGICHSGGDLTIFDSVISNNSVSGEKCFGGGVYHTDGRLAMTDATISGNRLTGSEGHGGGVSCNNSSVAIENSSITSNTIDGEKSSGGGFFCAVSTSTVANSTISGNSVGGVADSGFLSEINGGGICGRSSTLKMTGTTVSENFAAHDGGGIFLEGGAASVTDSKILDNAAEDNGGGFDNYGTLEVVGSVISGNTANFSGGGVINRGGRLTAISTTIAGNYASHSGGIENRRGELILTNSIVALNAAKVDDTFNPRDIGSSDFTFYSSQDESNCLIGVDPGFVVPPIIRSGKLVNREQLDLSLSAESAAIDGGSNSAVNAETDLAGNPRIVGDAVDIGAYEYQENTRKKGVNIRGKNFAVEPPPRKAENKRLKTSSTVVTTPLDRTDDLDGLVSLREAIADAESGDVITFDDSLAGETIRLTGSDSEHRLDPGLHIDKGITVDASSIGGITIDGGEDCFEVVSVSAHDNHPVKLIALKITGGDSVVSRCGVSNRYGELMVIDSMISGNSDAGIKNSGTMTVLRTIVAENSTFDGGGVKNDGTLTIRDSVIVGNTARGSGGGLENSGTLTIVNTTITGNRAENRGGGIEDRLGETTISNSIVSCNDAEEKEDISVGPFAEIAGKNNIVGKDPGFVNRPIFQKGKLANFGELDLTLKERSPAIDAGDNAHVKTDTDLAGNPRIVGGAVDLGAYEFGGTAE